MSTAIVNTRNFLRDFSALKDGLLTGKYTGIIIKDRASKAPFSFSLKKTPRELQNEAIQKIFKKGKALRVERDKNLDTLFETILSPRI